MFEYRQIVNGSLLRQCAGRNISIVCKIDNGSSGLKVKAQTTDDHPIQIQLAEPLSLGPESDWVEVIGVVAGADAIRAKEVIGFEKDTQEFDTESHNMLVQLLNHCKDIFVSS